MILQICEDIFDNNTSCYLINVLNFADNVSTTSSQEIRFSESNDIGSQPFYPGLIRSSSLTEHSEGSSHGGMENEFGTCSQINGRFMGTRAVTRDHNLDTNSLNSMPNELEIS